MSSLECIDSAADPCGVLNEGEIHFKSTKPLKDAGDLSSHLLLGDVLVIILYHVGYSDPLNQSFRYIVTRIAFLRTFRKYVPKLCCFRNDY